MTKPTLTEKDIIHIAALAALSVTNDEIVCYQKQLGETLQYVQNLAEIDTEKIPPTTHPNRQINVTFTDGEKNTRLLSAKDASSNAKHIHADYFIVPRIM